jgi:hypothetical protein
VGNVYKIYFWYLILPKLHFIPKCPTFYDKKFLYLYNFHRVIPVDNEVLWFKNLRAKSFCTAWDHNIKLHLQKAFVPPKRNKQRTEKQKTHRNKKRTETQKTHQETKNAQKHKSTMQYRIKIIRSRLFIGKEE